MPERRHLPSARKLPSRNFLRATSFEDRENASCSPDRPFRPAKDVGRVIEDRESRIRKFLARVGILTPERRGSSEAPAASVVVSRAALLGVLAIALTAAASCLPGRLLTCLLSCRCSSARLSPASPALLLCDRRRAAYALGRADRLRAASARMQHHHAALQYRQAVAQDGMATLRTLHRRRLCRYSAWSGIVARQRSASLWHVARRFPHRLQHLHAAEGGSHRSPRQQHR